MRAVPRMIDLAATWPAPAGPVMLMAGGAFCLTGVHGVCQVGETVEIDASWPMHAQWTGAGWGYLSAPPTLSERLREHARSAILSAVSRCEGEPAVAR